MKMRTRLGTTGSPAPPFASASLPSPSLDSVLIVVAKSMKGPTVGTSRIGL